MKITGETKLFLGLIAATVAVIVGALWFFSKPEPSFSRQDLLPSSASTTGNKDAKVYLVEFSDFQCPACKATEPAVDAVTKEFADRIVFGYRHFPLDQHAYAKRAAAAAEAAKRQGKFWEMHDALFTNQETLSDETVLQIAGDIKLNVETFRKDWNDPTIATIIEKDQAAGLQFGVNATPTFFLNGKKLLLTSFSDLRTEVVKALQ